MNTSAAVLHTTDAAFQDDVLKSEVPVLLDFWAEWCGPCKAIAPALEELAQEWNGQVRVVKINIDANPQTPRQFGVRGIPTLMVFKEGKVQATQIGAVPKGTIAQIVNQVR